MTHARLAREMSIVELVAWQALARVEKAEEEMDRRGQS